MDLRHARARRLLPGLALLGFLASCNSGANMTDASKKDPAALLDVMLFAGSERQLGELLLLHGSIKDTEVPTLAKSTTSWSQTKRRNAARLLALNSSTEANEALRRCVLQTSDLQIWAVALSKLLSRSEDKSLAASRPDLLNKALESEDERVLEAAVRAGILVQHPNLREVIARALRSGSLNVYFALQAALKSGAGPLEPLIREHLSVEKSGVLRGILVGILAHSDDPVTWDAIRKVIDHVANRYERLDIYNAFVDNSNPRLRAFLLERAQSPGPDRCLALHCLSRLGPSADLMRICVKIYEEPPISAEDSERLEYSQNECAESCDRYLSELASKKVGGGEARSFAKTWLSEHAVAKP